MPRRVSNSPSTVSPANDLASDAANAAPDGPARRVPRPVRAAGAATSPKPVAAEARRVAPLRGSNAAAQAPIPADVAPTPRKPAARKPRTATTSALVEVAPPAPPPPARPVAKLAHAGALPPAIIPAVALATPRRTSLVAIAIGVSLLLHALVLSVRFALPDLGRKASDLPLEVALVNARTKAKPSKADILAQANLDGGGNTDANRRAKSPLPVLPKDSARNEISVAAERVDALERQTKELLTQLRGAPVAAPQPKPNDERDPTESPTANEMMQKSLEAMRLEAQIAKDMDAYQKRPKRQFVGSRAQEYRFARYVEDWRLKIERVGNLNYPSAARDQRLHGSLLLTVGIRADGSVESVEVNRSSGHRVLDAAAVKIVTMSAPFAGFPPDIRRDTDILYITRTWTFTRGDELVSH